MKKILLAFLASCFSPVRFTGRKSRWPLSTRESFRLSGSRLSKEFCSFKTAESRRSATRERFVWRRMSKSIDLQGKVIMPGLVDSHSHIGEGSGADGSSPIQPDVRLLDSLNARASSIQRAQSGGITTVNVMPGSGHLDSGQTLYMKLRDGANTIDDLLIYDQRRQIYGRNEIRQRHESDSHGRRKFSRHAREIRRAGARAIRQSAGISRENSQSGQRQIETAAARFGDGSLRRSSRRQARRSFSHAPPRRHFDGDLACRKNSVFASFSSTFPKRGKSRTKSPKRKFRLR